MRLLVVSEWFPYPPVAGAKIRAYNLVRQLAATLAENGRQAVAQNFNIQRTVEQVERYLLGPVAGQ